VTHCAGSIASKASRKGVRTSMKSSSSAACRHHCCQKLCASAVAPDFGGTCAKTALNSVVEPDRMALSLASIPAEAADMIAPDSKRPASVVNTANFARNQQFLPDSTHLTHSISGDFQAVQRCDEHHK